MSNRVAPIPEGFHTFTPYLVVPRASEAIEFYQQALGAKERFRLPGGGGPGSVGHAELLLGNSIIMLADEAPHTGARSPQTLGGTSCSFVLYVEDCDAALARAVAAGAKVLQPIEDKFYGERSGCVTDPFGYHWTFMTHIEDVTTEEVKRRMAELMCKGD